MGLCGVLDISEKSPQYRLSVKDVSIALDNLTREQIIRETRQGHC